MFVLYSQNYAARALPILFNTPKKSLLKSSYPSQIFVPKKIPESKISNPKKSFDHPRHLKSRVPPWGTGILFNTPKKSLLKSSYLSQIFIPKKIPESKISNPKKSFDHPRHLKSQVPPWGTGTFLEACKHFLFLEN